MLNFGHQPDMTSHQKFEINQTNWSLKHGNYQTRLPSGQANFPTHNRYLDTSSGPHFDKDLLIGIPLSTSAFLPCSVAMCSVLVLLVLKPRAEVYQKRNKWSETSTLIHGRCDIPEARLPMLLKCRSTP